MTMWVFFMTVLFSATSLKNVLYDFGEDGLKRMLWKKIIMSSGIRTGFGSQGRDSWQLFRGSWNMKVCNHADSLSCGINVVRDVFRI